MTSAKTASLKEKTGPNTFPYGQADSPPESLLDSLRRRMDDIDAKLLNLLNQRAECSLEVGAYKRAHGLPVCAPIREKSLLEQVRDANAGPLSSSHLAAIYREILSASRDLQQPVRVAFLGPEGTFSHMAAQEQMGSCINAQPRGHLADVFAAVENGLCDLGVIPLDNSSNGAVGQSIDLFSAHQVYIQSEWYSRISLSLLGRGASLASIRTVYSHAQALGQCSGWLRQNLPQAEAVSVESTAAAAHLALSEKQAAAVGHRLLAAQTGLSLLQEGIEDTQDNWTRFCAITARDTSAMAARSSAADKVSILFSVHDRAGSLAAVLQVLAAAGVNMIKLESRPMRHQRWKYIFFADVDSGPNPNACLAALEAVRALCTSFRILGAYKAGESGGMV